jgi:hypothetical protein
VGREEGRLRGAETRHRARDDRGRGDGTCNSAGRIDGRTQLQGWKCSRSSRCAVHRLRTSDGRSRSRDGCTQSWDCHERRRYPQCSESRRERGGRRRKREAEGRARRGSRRGFRGDILLLGFKLLAIHLVQSTMLEFCSVGDHVATVGCECLLSHARGVNENVISRREFSSAIHTTRQLDLECIRESRQRTDTSCSSLACQRP